MTSPLTSVPGHEFARDRAPYDDPLGIATWRWRWNCSCGATGAWHAQSPKLAYSGWRQHLKNLRDRSNQGSGQRNDMDVNVNHGCAP